MKNPANAKEERLGMPKAEQEGLKYQYV